MQQYIEVKSKGILHKVGEAYLASGVEVTSSVNGVQINSMKLEDFDLQKCRLTLEVLGYKNIETEYLVNTQGKYKLTDWCITAERKGCNGNG